IWRSLLIPPPRSYRLLGLLWDRAVAATRNGTGPYLEGNNGFTVCWSPQASEQSPVTGRGLGHPARTPASGCRCKLPAGWTTLLGADLNPETPSGALEVRSCASRGA